MSHYSIKIPATSANLGVGFDSMGVAVAKFLTIEAEPADIWQVDFVEDFLKVLPSDESNLVIETAQAVAAQYKRELSPLRIQMASEIPLTHGLGSSSSAIVAGVELANYFADLNLTTHEKITLASKFEGHPDNVGPCITGGLFVGYYKDEELFYQTASLENMSLILSIPPYEISTEEARRALPGEYSRAVAVEQNALSNVMVMALLQQNYQQMGELMMRDLIHEPYRQPLIAEFDQVKAIAQAYGAYATVISGAGPTILTLCSNDQKETVYTALQAVESCSHEIVEVYQPVS